MELVEFESVVVNVSNRTNWFFIRAVTRDGIVGVGEASLSGSEAELERVVQRLAPGLRRIDPLLPIPLPRPADMLTALVMSAVEQACWDIRGKATHTPVRQLLGGQRTSVPVYANINRGLVQRTPFAFALAAEAAVLAGFGAVKCAPFDEYDSHHRADTQLIEAGIARVKGVRDAIGPVVKLIVDCHWRFDASDAIGVGSRLREIGIEWLEAPVPETDLQAVAKVRAGTGIRLAGAEWCWTADQFDLLSSHVDILMPDVKLVGIAGVVTVGRKPGLLAPHNPTGPVATASTLHAATAIERLEMVEIPFQEVDWFGELVGIDFALHDGSMVVTGSPGLGVNLDRDLVAAHPYRPVRDIVRRPNDL